MATYRTQITFKVISENISAKSAVNLQRSFSALISELFVNTKNQNYQLRHQHLYLQHRHQMQGVAGKVGSVLLSALFSSLRIAG
jgi:hypothetical protein